MNDEALGGELSASDRADGIVGLGLTDVRAAASTARPSDPFASSLLQRSTPTAPRSVSPRRRGRQLANMAGSWARQMSSGGTSTTRT